MSVTRAAELQAERAARQSRREEREDLIGVEVKVSSSAGCASSQAGGAATPTEEAMQDVLIVVKNKLQVLVVPVHSLSLSLATATLWHEVHLL